MEELYRILKPHGKLKIIVPYWLNRGMWNDPTHVRLPCLYMFDFLTKDKEFSTTNYITKARFKIIKRKFRFNKLLKPLEFLVNLFPDLYECSFLRFFIPAGSIYLNLKKYNFYKI